jgi:hypothetical protein
MLSVEELGHPLDRACQGNTKRSAAEANYTERTNTHQFPLLHIIG